MLLLTRVIAQWTLVVELWVVQPAITRMVILAGVPPELGSTWSLSALFMLLTALVAYDALSGRRVHRVTLVGAVLVFGTKSLSILVIAGSEFGRTFVRSL